MLLTILGMTGAEVLKEVVTTVEVSQHGARIRGRRTLQKNWQGSLLLLSSGRQAPCRIVWQAKPPEAPGFLEAGVEILVGFNFWERTFSNPDAEPVAAEIAVEPGLVSPEELLQELRKSPSFQGQEASRVLEAAWCGVVEQLEERKILTREELAAAIRKIGQK
jgi:hypothetical protein